MDEVGIYYHLWRYNHPKVRPFSFRYYWQLALKRLLDLVGSAVGLLLVSPVMLVVSLLIKFSSGSPILFRQHRIGKEGRIFTIYKFRTMKVDAEKETGPIWAKENDSRVTKMGSFLRRSHIDELPQLINVFKGEMSLVGPRPERPIFVEKLNSLVPKYNARLMVKPGITGLAQVRHRYDRTIVDVKRKLKYDILYIKKMCFLLDMRILALTLLVVFIGRQAR